MPLTANISGAGLGGLAAALALSSGGMAVRVFEQAEELGEVGAGVQLSPNAMWALRALGVERDVIQTAFEPRAAMIRDGRTGRPFLNAPLAATCRGRYGAPYVNIHRADLHAILLEAARKAGAEIETGAEVTGYATARPQPSFLLADGRAAAADLLVGADGVRSRIQAKMIAPDPPHFTGQVAWRGLVPTDALPAGLVPPDATVWSGPGRHFVTYYLRRGELVNFVAVEERSDWRGESWTEPGDKAALRDAFDGWRAEVTTVIDRVERCFLWALYDREPLPRWSDGPVALLGDACHPMPPFMAQGAAMAIEDAVTLARCVAEGADIPPALRRYEHLRKTRTSKVLARARANANLYHMNGLGARARLAAASLLPRKLSLAPLDWIFGFNPT